ncbi:DUF1854 domain-containing protein [Nitrosomonas sp. HPC101]|uniref:cyanophycin metabolism-associated DUF1854 family protein n=1 Tax=Nitrosomonas sp. HPC101 TaxID=1658667 RepID=UPI001370FB41|nr:DUF1854 domain-containing protein [Nitrosomonas sp. HPC101]MXS84400.1 DUF1854 domain-containing protein [Nitrosomonas sp. HPC101]
MNLFDCKLSRNVFGKLTIMTQNQIPEEVVPVRAFPITAAGEGIALVDNQGHEVVWIDNLAELPATERILIEQELVSREFMPEIKCIDSVSSFATPSTWQVQTDRGETCFILKGEEDIRRLSPTTLLITDSCGIHFLIRDRSALDRHSNKLLDRFL